MPAKPNYFKIGMFVIAACGIAIAAVAALGAGALYRKTVEVETYVDASVQSLEVGSSVKFRGVQVGNVKEITFVRTLLSPDHPDYYRYGRYVLIRMSIYADMFEDLTAKDVAPVLKRLIQEGLRARLASQGLTGQTYLELDYVEAKSNPPLAISWQPGAYYIPSAPSIMTKLTQTADRLFTQISESDIPKVAGDLDRFLIAATAAVEATHVEELRRGIVQLLDGLSRTNDRIYAFVADPALASAPADIARTAAASREAVNAAAAGIDAMLVDLRAATQSVRRTAEQIESLAGAEGLHRILDDITHATTGVRGAADGLPELIARLNRGSKALERVAVGNETDVAVLLENLRVISENLRYLTENARVYPSQLLFGEPPAHVQEEDR